MLLFFFLVFLLFFRQKEDSEEKEEEKFEWKTMIGQVKEYFHDILNASPESLKLNKEETIKVEHLRAELRKALNQCSYGDLSSKIYVKEHIKDFLINHYGITRENINFVIPFHNPYQLSHQDKFDILIHLYKKEYEMDAFHMFLEENDVIQQFFTGKEDTTPYEISEARLEEIYDQYGSHISFLDKINIIAQRIYQLYKGHGVIDEIRDMNVDGVSGGVSGRLTTATSTDMKDGICNSIWVFYHGVMIHLSFLSFSSEAELQRICRNIYRYGKPGQLSAVKGYIVNDMMDGSRVVVARPPFSESWSFFIRKFTHKDILQIEDLLTDAGAELVIEVLRYLIRGEQVMGITGEQGSGKTTLLKALIRFISPNYTLRVQELVFELHLREIYPDRNIVSFRETDEIPGREGLDLQKKTDGTVNIIGEVASAPVASWLVMISQVASKFTMFTHHAKTAEHLIMSLRNDLMITGAFQNERAAEEQVKASIRFDVHIAKNKFGHRYIERITEILPNQEGFIKVKDIIRFEQGRYQIKECISDTTIKEMLTRLSVVERDRLSQIFSQEVEE